jgi:alkylation response protein AidB-like acyl-CoA dehydrogenase
MTFFQTPPTLPHQYRTDLSLRSHLARLCDAGVLAEVEPGLDDLGALAAGEMLAWARQAEENPPTLDHYGPYGRRIDRINLSDGWKRLGRVGAEFGIVAVPHERVHGWMSRVHQYALLHLYQPSSANFGCPLAMSDGAVAALHQHADGDWATEARTRLMSRDPDRAWTAGQWMTEKEGGSDVSRTSTRAVRDGDAWRLHGTKYFTSATTSECALLLARPEGVGRGSKALALFFTHPWNADGTPNHIRVRRLKPKFGTNPLPTAEIELDGTVAYAVGGHTQGLRKITTVLNIARYFNTNAAVSAMRRSVGLAYAYAQVREAFGHRLIDLPLHLETLADMQVEYDAGLAVGMRLAELLGKVETGVATDLETSVWRLLTPLAKLGTGKQCVAVASECMECFGGVGYMEDSGIPTVLRDAQVLPIWEGTTNVLSLDALRAMGRENALEPFLADLEVRLQNTAGPTTDAVRAAKTRIEDYATCNASASPIDVQIGARGFALSLYRTYAAALLIEAAAWEENTGREARLRVSARRWAQRDLTPLVNPEATRMHDSQKLLGS